QGQTALDDQLLENRSQLVVFQKGADRDAVHQRRQIALLVGVFEVASEPAGRDGGVHFEAASEDHVRQRRPTPPRASLLQVRQATAQFKQQLLKAMLLGLLRLVVNRPVLLIGWLVGNGIGADLGRCAAVVACADELGRKDVFARLLV